MISPIRLFLVLFLATHFAAPSQAADWVNFSSYCMDHMGVEPCAIGGGLSLVTHLCWDSINNVQDKTESACEGKPKPADQLVQCAIPVLKSVQSSYALCDSKTTFHARAFDVQIDGTTIAFPGHFIFAGIIRRTHFQAQIAASYDEAIVEQLSAMTSNPLYDNQNIEYNVDLGEIDLIDMGLEGSRRVQLQQHANSSHAAHTDAMHEEAIINHIPDPTPLLQTWSLIAERVGTQVTWKAEVIKSGPPISTLGSSFVATINTDPDDIARLNTFTIGGVQLLDANTYQFSNLRQTCTSDSLDKDSQWTPYQFGKRIPLRANALMVEISPSYFYWVGGIGENRQFFNDVYALNFHDSHGRFRNLAEYTGLGFAPFSPRSSAAGGFLRHANDGSKFRGRVIVLGGATAQGIDSQVWTGDLDYNGYLHWNTQPLSNFDVTLAQRARAAFVVDRESDTLFIAGGFNAQRQALQDVWKVNADLTHVQLATLPAPRWGGALLFVDHQLLYLGGFDQSNTEYNTIASAYYSNNKQAVQAAFTITVEGATYIFPTGFDQQIR